MASTATARPNHYEVLGLAPGASADEVAQAFAREISPLRPRAFGGIAEASIAYETLRDPARRRAYDEALGMGAEPVREKPSPVAQEAAPAGAAVVKPKPKPKPDAGPQVELRFEPSLREVLAARRVEDERRRRRADAVAVWKRPGIIVGAVFVGVGLAGAVAGLWSGREVAPKEAPATVSLPPAKVAPPAAAPAAPLETAPPPVVAPPPHEVTPRAAAPAPAKAAPAPATLPIPTDAAPEQQPAVQSAPDESSSEPTTAAAATDTTDVVAVTASLPLPDKVVARTIERIGYGCGAVDSTTAVEGAPGVFKVTGTSGDSYKATPVHGRYHFRRWGSR